MFVQIYVTKYLLCSVVGSVKLYLVEIAYLLVVLYPFDQRKQKLLRSKPTCRNLYSRSSSHADEHYGLINRQESNGMRFNRLERVCGNAF